MKNMKKAVILCLTLVLAAGLTACTKDTVYLEESTENHTTEIITPIESDESAFCCVYVCGAVQNPGIYELPATARVADAIEAAGGLTENAAAELLNLAEKITDEEKILVPDVTSATEQISEAAQADDGRVNLNTATIEQLMTLPGIGSAKAESILAYRTEHGKFDSVEDIKNITGIKDGVFVKIKDSITVN